MKSRMSILLLAIVTLLAACKGKPGNEEFYKISDSADTSAIAARADSVSNPAEKLVKTADMRFKVKNVEETSRQIVTLTKSIKGLVLRNRIGSSEINNSKVRKSGDSVMQVTTFNTHGEITVKIPSEHLDDFMADVTKMGLYINNRRTEISDMSLDYLSAQLKYQNRRELVNQQKAGKVVIKNPANVMLLKDEMIDQQIGNKTIDDAVRNSVVNLSFYQSNTIFKEIVVNDDPEAYKLPFFKRMIDNVANGWTLFGEMLLALVNIWMFIVAAIVAWLLIWRYKRNKAPILVKS